MSRNSVLDARSLPQDEYKDLVAAVVGHVQGVMTAEFKMSPVAIPPEHSRERSRSPIDATSPILGAVGEEEEEGMPVFVLPARLSELSLNVGGDVGGGSAVRASAVAAPPLAPPDATAPSSAFASAAVARAGVSVGAPAKVEARTDVRASAVAASAGMTGLTVAVDLPPAEGSIGSDNGFVATPASSHPAFAATKLGEVCAKRSLLYGSPTAKTKGGASPPTPPLAALREDTGEDAASAEAGLPSGATSPCRRASSDASTASTPGPASTGVVWLTKGSLRAPPPSSLLVSLRYPWRRLGSALSRFSPHSSHHSHCARTARRAPVRDLFFVAQNLFVSKQNKCSTTD